MLVQGIVDFFLEVRLLAPGLTDGASAPAFNLRSLARALQYAAYAAPLHGLQRALFDGFAMAFKAMLDEEGSALVDGLILKHVLRGRPLPKSLAAEAPQAPSGQEKRYVNVEVSDPLTLGV
jgi:midasin